MNFSVFCADLQLRTKFISSWTNNGKLAQAPPQPILENGKEIGVVFTDTDDQWEANIAFFLCAPDNEAFNHSSQISSLFNLAKSNMLLRDCTSVLVYCTGRDEIQSGFHLSVRFKINYFELPFVLFGDVREVLITHLSMKGFINKKTKTLFQRAVQLTKSNHPKMQRPQTICLTSANSASSTNELLVHRDEPVTQQRVGGGGVLNVIADKKDLGERGKVFLEFKMTETVYLNQLQNILKNYYLPLRDTEIVDADFPLESIQAIFGGIDEMFNAGFLFQKQLTYFSFIICADDKADVFPAFAQFKELLDFYPKYIANFLHAMALVQKLAITQTWSRFIQKSKLNTGDLESSLFYPVQRVLRYQMLLTELVKNTPPTHKDYAPLNELLTSVIQTAKDANQKMGEVQKLQNVQKILQAFIPALQLTSVQDRNLLSEGILKVSNSEFYFFLFSDCLAFGKFVQSSAANSYKGMTFTLCELSYDVEISNVLDSTKGFQFNIGFPEKTLTVFASSDVEKARWLNSFEEFNSKQIDGSRCSLCRKALSIVFQRFLCYQCGKMICSECLVMNEISGFLFKTCVICHANPPPLQPIQPKQETVHSPNQFSESNTTLDSEEIASPTIEYRFEDSLDSQEYVENPETTKEQETPKIQEKNEIPEIPLVLELLETAKRIRELLANGV